MIRVLISVVIAGLIGCSRPAAIEPAPVEPPDTPVVSEPPEQLPESSESLSPAVLEPDGAQLETSVLLQATGSVMIEPSGTTSIREVNVARVLFDISGATAGSEAVVEILAPSGTPYQVRSRLLDASQVESWPIEVRVPVAGTVIHESRLSGTWTARLAVNGAFISTRTFTLDP